MSYADFQLSFQTCPIVLMQGIAGTGVLPLVEVLNPSVDKSVFQVSSAGLVGSTAEVVSATGDPEAVGPLFGSFRVLPGGTLMDNEVAHFPLASMEVAANAVITNPLRFAVEMAVPAGGAVSLSRRLSIFTSLKNVLDNHIAAGGYFNVATPAYIYTGCLLLNMVDSSDVPDGSQTQTRWTWNFEQPLLTLQQAQAAVNNAMSKITSQTYNAGQPPGEKPLLTSVSNPAIGQQITPGADNAAGVTQTVPIAPSGGPAWI